MQKYLILILIFSCLFICNAFAQTTNDSCQSAYNVGFIPNGSIGTICFDGQINVQLIDSTDLALPNFPYPNIPLPCNGYVSSVAVPGKDIWFKFYTNCDLTFRVENSDSVHLSFWIGDDCNNLLPVQCYTIAEGLSFSQTLNGLGGHYIYLQVSGPNTFVNTNFTICLSGTIASCFPIFNFTSTPVRCFVYDLQFTNCSSNQVNDGSVTLSSFQGNPPYTCFWSDGFNGFSRNNLAPGIYYLTITDVNGCSVNDSVVISVSTSLFLNETKDFDILNDTKSKVLTILCKNSQLNTENYFMIKNTLGQQNHSEIISSRDKIVFDYSSLPIGIYYLHFKFQNIFKVIKFQIIN